MACVSGWVSPLSLPGSTTEAAPKVLMSQYHASLRSLALPLCGRECASVCVSVCVCVCVCSSFHCAWNHFSLVFVSSCRTRLECIIRVCFMARDADGKGKGQMKRKGRGPCRALYRSSFMAPMLLSLSNIYIMLSARY